MYKGVLQTYVVCPFFHHREGIEMEEVLSQVFKIWYLIGAAFVFFMQAGFAMVEAGFT